MEKTIAQKLTMELFSIPIKNLYYLLCYAWNQLEQGELVDISGVPTTDLADLFAVVLCEGTQHLVRRGLEQDYELFEGEVTGVRGRIDVLRSAQRFSIMHSRAACRFDELTVNTLPNQILKSTLHLLGCVSTLHKKLHKRVWMLHRDLHVIDDITLTPQSFRRVQLHSNNRFYRFLLNVCELVQSSLLPDQNLGTYKFRNFVRDEHVMARVFQDFLFNFIRLEILGWDVKREQISWQAESESDPGLTLLPRMETDISLSRKGRHVIIDAKYYQSTFNQYFETFKFHSGNLYQLMSYLTNSIRQKDERLSGVLIYPRIDRTLREEYIVQGYPIMVCTVDLNMDWQNIRNELFSLFGEHSSCQN